MNERHLEAQIRRLEHQIVGLETALLLIARTVIRDQNELNALIKSLKAPHSALSSTVVKVT